MAMRDLVSGGAACAVDGSSSSSSSNPLGALANALIGSSSKTKERLEEIPQATSSGRIFDPEVNEPLSNLTGSDLDRPLLQPGSKGSEFIGAFRSADQNRFADVWDDIQHNQVTPLPREGPPQRVLSNFLHSFVESSRGGMPFRPVPLPMLGLSQGDKQCIRDRSSIMARHFFADKSEEFINAQVNTLLSSLDVDSDIHANRHLPSRLREMENPWNDSQGMVKPIPHVTDGWVAEYSQHQTRHGDPEAWAHSFEQQLGTNGWVSEFEQEQSQLTSLDHIRGVNVSSLAAIEQTHLLTNTLSQNSDPKFQLIVDDNQVKQASSGAWAAEYQKQYNPTSTWVEEYNSQVPDQWAKEFTSDGYQHGQVDDQWINEFSSLNLSDIWAEEFGNQIGQSLNGEYADSWASDYDEFVNEQIAAKQQSSASKGVYVFSDMNPYVGHPNPSKVGQELFRRGLLSEAVLALEAEVLKNPENAEGWRLLGIAHAENDDDQQAIAAMMRAQEADPTNLEVLLALGVSHTNELEQAAALRYLYGWLRHHPKYGTIAPPELSDSLYYADVAMLFNEAGQMSPEDADVHIVLGVLYNLSKEYDRAIESFRTALKLKPNDYSLWNKLGATQANSVQSADAIEAYQQALDLKPNYVRAWANMGISYANQGMYEDSIRYYVRALAMNPKADNAWQYLRISLSCASRSDMLVACDSRDLDLLQKEFPL